MTYRCASNLKPFCKFRLTRKNSAVFKVSLHDLPPKLGGDNCIYIFRSHFYIIKTAKNILRERAQIFLPKTILKSCKQ